MKDYLIDTPLMIDQGELAKLTVQNSTQIAALDKDLKNVKASDLIIWNEAVVD